MPHEVVVEPLDEGSCLVHARSNSLEMLALYLGMLDADFTVTDPPELIEQLDKLSRWFGSATITPQ